MAPAAALLLVSLGIYLRSRTSETAAQNISTHPTMVSDAAVAGLNDDDLLQGVAQQSPALREEYADHLRHVNQYIQDAKTVVAADPNDEEARRSLMEAYPGKKAMLFELALDRSLQ